MGKLHPEQLQLIYQQKWFKALMPVTYGGRDLTIPQLVRLQEGLSWADGSFGWVFTLCCGAGWFAGFIDPELATDLFAGEQTCLAGSGASTGEAVILPDGYLLNGVWNYASGAYHATHFTANCIIKNGGETVLNPDGSPLILPFIIDKKEVELLDTWKYVGMVATGSNSFKIENVKVDKTRCFKIDADAVTLQSKLYKYPFRQLAEATLAANIMGMAIHFVDLAEEIIRQRTELGKFTEAQQIFLNNKLANAKTEINIIRERFYKAVDESWELNIQPALNQVSITSRKLAQTARLHVDDLYPYCGLMAASPDTEINRVWRDVHTASQHTLLTFES
jgi:indole-3-acetate monooxygenase